MTLIPGPVPGESKSTISCNINSLKGKSGRRDQSVSFSTYQIVSNILTSIFELLHSVPGIHMCKWRIRSGFVTR